MSGYVCGERINKGKSSIDFYRFLQNKIGRHTIVCVNNLKCVLFDFSRKSKIIINTAFIINMLRK